MSDEDVREAVIQRYKEVYPRWSGVTVASIVRNVLGRDLVVVKGVGESGTPTDGEICFVEANGKVRVFQTTEDLAEALRPDLPVEPHVLGEAKAQVSSFAKWHRARHGQNYWVGTLMVLSGIILALGVTAAGFFNQGVLAGVLGLFVALLIGMQNAFLISEKAEFQRLIFNEADNLHDLLSYRVRSQSQFDSVLDSFMTLRKYAATSLPRGKGMEVVKEMYGTSPKGV